MKIIIDEQAIYQETTITIQCQKMDEALLHLVNKIRLNQTTIQGKLVDETYQIVQHDIFYFESLEEKTFLYTETEVYQCTQKLYELETLLTSEDFQRISKSCLLNMNKIASFRSLLNGKLEASLLNGEKVVVNRHYVKGLKQKLSGQENGGNMK